ncbi:MAG TPA: helix-turn-helix transcriptional regulator [Armatimonadota bacterium]|nr:helix-turn-helix transcriptional regulator [Armatimonadota bacterium]
MATIQEVIGARIRALRQEKGWTQEDLGGRADLDFTTIGGAERGEKSLSLNSLSRVAEALDVSIAWLVRDRLSETGEAECEGLTEELLALVRDLPPEELRHVLGLVRAALSYLVTQEHP